MARYLSWISVECRTTALFCCRHFVLAIAISLAFLGSAAVMSAAPAGSIATDGQPTPPANVTDVASCESYLTSLGGDPGNANTGCQAMQSLAQMVNQPFGTVFGCSWTQAAAVKSGGQVDTAALLGCLGVGH